MDRTLSAPGKLFLCGEYAVLWGGMARILAVEPRLQALVRRRVDRQVDVVLAPGRIGGPATPAGVRWRGEVPEPFRFVAAAIDLALRLVGTEGPGFSVAFESSSTVDGVKLGLGSSARAAMLATEGARWALDAHFDALKLALVAHADAQGGVGSGGDVAALFAGGMVRYRKYETRALLGAARRGGLLTAMAQSSPVDLRRLGNPVFPMLFAHSGRAVSTVGQIQEAERRLDEPARKRFADRSDGLGDMLEQGLLRGDFLEVRLASEGLQALLDELRVTQDQGIEQILNLARTFGCTGKQSGAGGGDGAVLFAPDEEARRSLHDALAARHFYASDVRLARGLESEVQQNQALNEWLNALE